MAPRTNEGRLSAVEQRIADHESRCEERLREIKADGAETRKAVEGIKSRFWAIALALLAWALAQVYSTLQDKPQPSSVEAHATSR